MHIRCDIQKQITVFLLLLAISSEFCNVISAIGNAFSVLSNPVKRKRYDEFGLEELSRVLPPRQRRQRYTNDDNDGCYGYTYGFESMLFRISLCVYLIKYNSSLSLIPEPHLE